MRIRDGLIDRLTTIRDACAERTRAKIEARDGVKNARCVSSVTVDANGSRARVCRWARDSRVHPEAPRSFEGDGTHRRVMTRERILLGRRRRFPFPRARGRAATSERDARSVRASGANGAARVPDARPGDAAARGG